MRVLVTGGAGYVGSHVARELVSRGHDVLLYDNLSTGHRFLTGQLALIEGDTGDAERVSRAVRGVDAVMHFAAHTYVGESVNHPRKYFENNVRSGIAFLNAVLDAGVRLFVFSSTCAVYGLPEQTPIPEDTPRQPVNPYGASKLFFEHALEAYSVAYGLRFVSLRYFNAAGAHESGEIGELHVPETHLIPVCLLAAAGLRQPLEIYGDDYPTPDGTCIRDYIHVSDLAVAHALALQYLAGGGGSTALNLGTGKGYSVKQIVDTVERITSRILPRRLSFRRPGDPPVLIADPSRAQQTLGWRARHSLEEIVSSAWKWMARLPEILQSEGLDVSSLS